MISNLILLANAIQILSANPNYTFNDFIHNASEPDVEFAEQNNIDNWDDYYNYLESVDSNVFNSWNMILPSFDDISMSEAIDNVEEYLEENFNGYYWIKDPTNCKSTINVTGNIPIEMQSISFPTPDLNQALENANISNITSYGGCGPIAQIGIFDYFSRYIGYSEFINDPTNNEDRIELATDVFNNTRYSFFCYFNRDKTLVWPKDYKNCFDTIVSDCGLDSTFSCECDFSLFLGNADVKWNSIVDSINKGIPATLFTGFTCGNGSYSEHYTNIYAYEEWVGIPYTGGNTIRKRFFKSRLNWGVDEHYCNADILYCTQIGLITYKINYDNSYPFYKNDFANYFVNDQGNGQYFFYEKSITVPKWNGVSLYTNRLRTSYIENNYLVMSPNRINAGIAYLDIYFNHGIEFLNFDSSLWSSNEVIYNQYFSVQYWNGNHWIDRISIDLTRLSTQKDFPDSFNVVFPRGTRRIRFYTQNYSPNCDRNKGRICLDSFRIESNIPFI